MTGQIWVCDSCHTNNRAHEKLCRVCGLSPGSATGAIRVASDEAPRERSTDAPEFVESRHTTIFLTPPTPAPTEPAPKKPTPKRPAARPAIHRPTPAPALRPPSPWPPKHRPARKSGSARLAFAVIFIAVIVVIIIANASKQSQDPSGSTPDPAQTSTPNHSTCPDNVARWLPDNGDSDVLIARYDDDTNHFVATICQDSATGQYYYDGQVNNEPVNDNTHISLPATQTGSGFVAANGDYQYEIAGTELIVSENSTVIKESQLIRVA
jgi:hypothetical protein